MFSLFYSGPFDYVKFDVVVGLKESVLGAYLGEECGKTNSHLCFNLISRLAIEFDVVPSFLLNCGAGGMLSDVSLFI